MNLNKKLSIVGFCALVFVVLSFATAGLAGEMTITGKVTDEGILADDEQLYAVADNDKGQELLELMDKKVEVTGTVEESEGKKIITVTSFKVIEE